MLKRNITLLVECKGTVLDIKGNFIACEMSYPLRKGSSGSPIFYKGKLAGILSAGDESREICIFQNAQSIMQLLHLRSNCILLNNHPKLEVTYSSCPANTSSGSII